jgi:hypothetical protein
VCFLCSVWTHQACRGSSWLVPMLLWLRRLAFANLLNIGVWRRNPHANEVQPAGQQKPLKGEEYGPTGPAGKPVRASGHPADCGSSPAKLPPGSSQARHFVVRRRTWHPLRSCLTAFHQRLHPVHVVTSVFEPCRRQVPAWGPPHGAQRGRLPRGCSSTAPCRFASWTPFALHFLCSRRISTNLSTAAAALHAGSVQPCSVLSSLFIPPQAPRTLHTRLAMRRTAVLPRAAAAPTPARALFC